MPSPKKYIAHLDLDCFYVSVERNNDPSLRGKPVIVGGSPTGRGVVASASYEARAFGVRSAMPTGKALKLCPHAVIVRGHFEEYAAVSKKLCLQLKEIAPVVEQASIDEMYLDFTGCESLYGNDLPAYMKTLQHIVWKEFSLPCAIALASNKLVAKIAVGTAKPAGVLYVPHGEERTFLAPLPVDVIPGVGPVNEKLLKRHGFSTVADLQQATRERLVALLGSQGAWLYRAARGIGSDHVQAEHTRKSIGREETFHHDTADIAQLEKILFTLVEVVCSRLRGKKWWARTVTLKLRYFDFRTLTRSCSITPTEDDGKVFQAARELLAATCEKGLPVRLIGVTLTNFTDGRGEESLFPPPDAPRRKVFEAVDRLRDKFGDDIIHLGSA